MTWNRFLTVACILALHSQVLQVRGSSALFGGETPPRLRASKEKLSRGGVQNGGGNDESSESKTRTDGT